MAIKEQTGKANQFETVSQVWQLLRLSVQAFKQRTRETVETQRFSMPKKSWSYRAMHINSRFKGDLTISPWKAPCGAAAWVAEHSIRLSPCPEKSVILAGMQKGTAFRGCLNIHKAEISLMYM